ncbi:uncharacterized protein LOC103721023 isoform X2 [Phoenix dactylifera]|uniref:Uncharacterized protein LOC103721023 isoform X2 n=1 Tax=Phoenix dactylifera TaxID=42345 RepID=A0A8B9A389_PHODC|nr:uncharacterized protein LOC103721023 isoform X2 [Phoenix dactylifera]
MDSENLKDVIDLETGTSRTSSAQEGSDNSFSSGNAKKLLTRVWSGLGGLMMGEEAVNLGNVFSCSIDGCYENGEILAKERFDREDNVGPFKKIVETDRPRRKASKRPPKPPRPPKSLSLNAFDQKLVNEISELAMLRQARIERMKMLKKKRNTKAASSNTNLCAMVITILFFLIIIWKGILAVYVYGEAGRCVIVAGFGRVKRIDISILKRNKTRYHG